MPNELPTTPNTPTPTPTRPARMTRRGFAVAALGLVAGSSLAANVAARAPIVSTRVGEVPTTGGLRPGPIGLNPPPVIRTRGVLPVAIRIDKAQVDAEIEQIAIVDGVMQNPTGPWVVSWYKETSRPGEDGNVVMAGHVDYWDVGAAVFWYLRDLKEGDEIVVTGENGDLYTYAVEWIKDYDAENAPIQEIVGPTEDEALTLITCGGEFDYATGEYLQRKIVRAKRVEA